MQSIRFEGDLFTMPGVSARDTGSARRAHRAAVVDGGDSLLKHAIGNVRVLRDAGATAERHGRICLVVLGLHAYRCMHRLVAHTSCSVAAIASPSHAGHSQASDLAAGLPSGGVRVLIRLSVTAVAHDEKAQLI